MNYNDGHNNWNILEKDKQFTIENNNNILYPSMMLRYEIPFPIPHHAILSGP